MRSKSFCNFQNNLPKPKAVADHKKQLGKLFLLDTQASLYMLTISMMLFIFSPTVNTGWNIWGFPGGTSGKEPT